MPRWFRVVRVEGTGGGHRSAFAAQQGLDFVGEFDGSGLVAGDFRIESFGERCEAGLKLVAGGGEVGEVLLVGEWLAEAGLVVMELGFGEGEVLSGGGDVGGEARGEAVGGVEDRAGALVFAGELVGARSGSGEGDFWWGVGVKGDGPAEALELAEGDGAG